jgi:anti-sigma factor RsiW
MNEPACEEMGLLIQADLDGELQASEAARIAVHIARCGACAETQTQLLALSDRVRRDATRYAAPASARRAIRARLQDASPRHGMSARGRLGVASVGGFALAACIALAVLLPRASRDGSAEAIVSAHIRALQPGHLMDVVSTDQHTVKPWFDGKLPFAPPVTDYASIGFPLAGGRLDFINGKTAAALIYRRDKHLIDVFAWPGNTADVAGTLDGYHFRAWTQRGMAFWAVSDLNTRELDMLVDALRRQ